jgi:AbrB family looped-hinge helix DNA binding protein
MTATLTIDSAGRIVLPKRIREKLHLAKGTKLRADIVGDKLELEVEQPEATVVRNKSGRRVIVGWEGFDAVAAIKQDRAERDAKLIGIRKPSSK